MDLIAVRTHAHSQLEEFAAHSRVPVINALSDDFHPCQLLADVQTFMEVRGSSETRVWPGSAMKQHVPVLHQCSGGFRFSLSIAAQRAMNQIINY